MLAWLKKKLRFHPRAFLHAFLTYPRFLGRIKPELMTGREEEIRVRLLSLGSRWEPANLSVPVGRRLLVIAPHADDEAIGVGGLLLAHRGQAEVHIVNVFNGEGGGRLSGRAREETDSYKGELVEARKKELGRVAAKIGAASVTHLGLRDGQGLPSAEAVRRLKDIIDKIKPDVVLLPWFLDNQRDHKVANLLYASACAEYDCLVLGFEIWTLCHPNAHFDITDWLDEKVKLVSEYQTQTADIDYAGYARGLGATRGFLQNVRNGRGAAEALFAVPGPDYCEIVHSLFGTLANLTPTGRALS